MRVSDEVQVTVSGPTTRAVRSTGAGRGTHGPTELRLLVEGALHTAFPHRVWVLGRVAGTRLEHAVGLHFTLASSVDDDEPFELACLLTEDALEQVGEVLGRLYHTEVADLVTPERLVRAGGLLRYDAVRATLVLQVSELDPTPALRSVEEQRASARQVVRAQGLLERQRARAGRAAPLVVGLVGDEGAVGRARAVLEASPYAVQVRGAAVPLHGVAAGGALAHRVREAALCSDVVLAVREAGRPLSLAAFDAPEVSAAIADATVPVVCGLSGLGQATAGDEVAHTALNDPEGAARWVLERLDGAHTTLRTVDGEVQEQARAAHDRARAALDQARREVDDAVDRAQTRSAVVRARLRARSLWVAAVIAVAFLVAAVVLGAPLLLLGVAAVALALPAAALWSRQSMSRGSRPMSQQDDDFAAVLARLRDVRSELASTSSPETVHRLRGEAAQLVARGEQVLTGTAPGPTGAEG